LKQYFVKIGRMSFSNPGSSAAVNGAIAVTVKTIVVKQSFISSSDQEV
jgi:hypothetical protein